MPYVLLLSQALRRAGWKVKIHDFERLEPPHATLYCKRRKWRLSLRDGSFLDQGDKWGQIDEAVKTAIEASWQILCDEWDALHPDNPVSREENDNDDQ